MFLEGERKHKKGLNCFGFFKKNKAIKIIKQSQRESKTT